MIGNMTSLYRSTLLRTRGTLLGLTVPALLLAGCAVDTEDPQEEAVADDDAGDLAEGTPDDAPLKLENIAFDVESASNLIVDKKGETIGYLDARLQQRALDGALAPASAHSFFSSPQRVMLYSNGNYSGVSTSYHSTSPTFTANLNSFQNDQTSSVVAAPGCRVDLYDGINQTGALLISINANQGSAIYINLTASNDKASSMRVSCKNNDNILCGYLYKDANYGGDAFPVYNEYRYDLSGFPGWNDTASSVAMNPYATCDGIGLWQHKEVFGTSIDVNQKRQLVRKGFSNANLHTSGMGDQATAIEADRELSSTEANNGALGRALTAMQTKRGWGKAFVCNSVKQVCVDHRAAINSMTTLTGFYTCGKLVGGGVVTALATAAVTIATGGAAAAAVAPLDAFAASQVLKGVGCLAATGLAVVLENSLCDATMETYCNQHAR
jgi:hypothetical protein